MKSKTTFVLIGLSFLLLRQVHCYDNERILILEASKQEKHSLNNFLNEESDDFQENAYVVLGLKEQPANSYISDPVPVRVIQEGSRNATTDDSVEQCNCEELYTCCIALPTFCIYSFLLYLECWCSS